MPDIFPAGYGTVDLRSLNGWLLVLWSLRCAFGSGAQIEVPRSTLPGRPGLQSGHVDPTDENGNLGKQCNLC